MKKKIAVHFQMELKTSYLGYCSKIISEKLSKKYWTDSIEDKKNLVNLHLQKKGEPSLDDNVLVK